MEKINYLIVVDTTDAQTRVNLQRGILNAYIILALDPIHAKKLLLSQFPRGMADQLADALYVYDLADIGKNLEAIDQRNIIPMFSFMPQTGGRPQKQSDVKLTQSGNQTLSPNPIMPAQNNQPIQRTVPSSSVTGGGRSQEFQRVDSGRPPTSNVLTNEQAELIGKFGGNVENQDVDEGVNLRVNTSTGMNHNLNRQQNIDDGNTTININQAEILNRLNVKFSETVDDPELMKELSDRGVSSLVDDNLTRIDDVPLDEATIKRLQSEE